MHSRGFGTKRLLVFGVLFFCSVSQARDRALLNKAVDDSNLERAGIEKLHQTAGRIVRASNRGQVNTIQVEIGDGLAPENDGFGAAPARLQADYAYREKGVARKLEREWREVNRPALEKVHSRKARGRHGASSGHRHE